MTVLTRQADRADASALAVWPGVEDAAAVEPASRPGRGFVRRGSKTPTGDFVADRPDRHPVGGPVRAGPRYHATPRRLRSSLGRRISVNSDGLLNDPTILRHQVTASGLEPGTRYAYAIGDGSAHGWSDWFVTTTAPGEPRDYSFLYLGDAQCELERWGELAHAARQARPDAGFMLLAGGPGRPRKRTVELGPLFSASCGGLSMPSR